MCKYRGKKIAEKEERGEKERALGVMYAKNVHIIRTVIGGITD